MNYIIDHIPLDTPHNRRPGLPLVPETITIHNTGNPRSSARNERNWLTNPSNDRTASFHIAVDEREAIECIPLKEVAWAAGDGTNGPGNRTSIHIEVCESGNYAKTLENTTQLVVCMLQERGWDVDRLRRHFDWSGKLCPRLMYDGGSWRGWNDFINRVRTELQGKVDENGRNGSEDVDKRIVKLEKRIAELESQRRMAIPDWAKEAVDAAVKAGYINTPEGGSLDFYRIVTVLHRAGVFNSGRTPQA